MAKKNNGTVKRIDTKYFDTAIQELTSAISEFDSALKNVDKKTTALQGTWEGKGADKFKSAYKRLKDEFDDQEANLTAMRDDLKAILDTYEGWDQELSCNMADNSVS